MDEQAFEIVSLAMRYWFIALMVIAVMCAWRLNRVQAQVERKARRDAPNREYIGELLVIKGSGSVERSERYPIQRDIVIGRRRRCDVTLYDRSVRARHARAELRSGGMYIAAIGSAPISLRGQPIKSEFLVRDGALFCIGGITLQLTLYDVTAEYEPESEARTIYAASVDGDPFDAEPDGDALIYDAASASESDLADNTYDEGEYSFAAEPDGNSLPEYDADYDVEYGGKTGGSSETGSNPFCGAGTVKKRTIKFSPLTYSDANEEYRPKKRAPDDGKPKFTRKRR